MTQVRGWEDTLNDNTEIIWQGRTLPDIAPKAYQILSLALSAIMTKLIRDMQKDTL